MCPSALVSHGSSNVHCSLYVDIYSNPQQHTIFSLLNAPFCSCIAWLKQCPLHPVRRNLSQPSTAHRVNASFCSCIAWLKQCSLQPICGNLSQPSAAHQVPAQPLKVNVLKIIHSFVVPNKCCPLPRLTPDTLLHIAPVL